jgi:ribonuclease Z
LKFEVTILGCGSALPTAQRNPSAQYVNAQERHLLIDCAEGTQLALRRYNAPLQRLNAVFISHLHGDHYLGLMGLLSTMHLLGRQKPLILCGPGELMDIIELQLRLGNASLQFQIEFTPLQPGKGQVVFEDKLVLVESFPLNHRIDCWGFRVSEKIRFRKINRAATDRYGVPVAWMRRVVEGEDFTDDSGNVIPNSWLTFPPPRPKSYAYCSDTAYDERIVPNIAGADVLYHEATFGEALKSRAKETYHSTAKEAATIAEKAGVGRLIIGHFSARYRSTDELLAEARTVFAETEAACDGMVIRV